MGLGILCGVSPESRPASTTPTIVVENVPADLKARPQWVTWRYEKRDGKWTKTPYNAKTGKRASATSSRTWCPFEHALRAARERGYDGIGFVFSKTDGYVGIDLDDCLDDDGNPVREAQEILDKLDSYTEISPSRKGVKVWVRAALPDGKGRRTKAEGFGEIEMYDRGRFFTVTGWRLS